MSGFRASAAKAVLVAAVFLLAGHFLVLQRTPSSTEEVLRVRGDSLEYFRMAEGDGSASPPFRYRPLVPYVVSLLPVGTSTGFVVVSYSALFLCFLVLYFALQKFALKSSALLSGLLLFFFSEATLYQFHNPYLTDSAGFLFLFLVFYAASQRRLLVFGAAAAAGLLCREATLFAVPTYLHARQFRGFVVVSVVLLSAFLIPRVLFRTSDGTEGYFAGYLSSARELGRLDEPLGYLKDIFYTWDLVWLSALLGLLLVPRERLPFFLLSLLCLGGGAFLSGLVTTDVKRMFSLAAPPLVCLAAECLGRVKERSLLLWCTVLVFLAGRALFSVPTLVNPSAYTLAGSDTGRQLILGLSALLFLLCVLVLRRDVRGGLKGSQEFLGRRRP